MARQIFRKDALERLSSPEQLDDLIQATPPKSWVALLTLLFLLGVAIVWGVMGKIPTKINGQGILVSQDALTSIISLSSGQIERLHVQVDEYVQVGQVVATLAQPELENVLEEAQGRLKLLYKELSMTRDYGDEFNELRTKNIDEQRLTLTTSLNALEVRAEKLNLYATHYQELVKEELATSKEYIDAVREYDNAIEQINTIKAKFSELSASKTNIDSQQEKENIALEHRILKAEEEVSSLTEKLERFTKITSLYSGKVTEIFKNTSMYINTGEAFLTIEQGGNQKALTVIAYFAPYEGKQIRKGMAIGVAPSVIRREEYGFILGRIEYVSSFPASSLGMMQVLRSQNLVQTLSEGGAPIMVKAELELDPATVSGFRWSSGNGPNMSVNSGTLCDVNVIVKEQPPATLVIPFLKQTFLGIGDERLDRGEE